MEEKELNISIILPCLNEEETVGACVDAARAFIGRSGLKGEVIVVDNGSTDTSARIAESRGARVITEENRGYGRAIRTGLAHSHGRVLIIADSDMTYDLVHLEAVYEPLAQGRYDLMIGDRFLGGIEKGAMPVSHKLGVRFLSAAGRWRFHTDVHDFHCGLRGITREALEKLDFTTDGMEFATEMIAQAAARHLRTGQTGVVLKNCPCRRVSKLRTVRDGLRHLGYILKG